MNYESRARTNFIYSYLAPAAVVGHSMQYKNTFCQVNKLETCVSQLLGGKKPSSTCHQYALQSILYTNLQFLTLVHATHVSMEDELALPYSQCVDRHDACRSQCERQLHTTSRQTASQTECSILLTTRAYLWPRQYVHEHTAHVAIRYCPHYNKTHYGKQEIHDWKHRRRKEEIRLYSITLTCHLS